MTKFLNDILKQPEQLQLSLDYTLSDRWNEIEKAIALIRSAKTFYISGIGASWNAGLAIQSAFNELGIPSILCDSSEFLHFTIIPKNSVILFLSRSGKSIEIVNSLPKCKASDCKIISITNDPDSLLAKQSDVCLLTHVDFDNSISVNTYTSIILTGQLLATGFADSFSKTITSQSLNQTLDQVKFMIPGWQEKINNSKWLDKESSTYFLARGSSLSSAFEGMLIWQEGAKQPASAMTTGAFRHGPQEILLNRLTIGCWVDNKIARDFDFKLLNDLHNKGISLLTIGTNLPADLKGIKIEMPDIIHTFQPLINVIPIQLAAELFSRIKGEDCDSFRYCNFVVESEGGL
jgi:glucosamine--fructose-6-phosphate aminotransferase (isomerizing)